MYNIKRTLQLVRFTEFLIFLIFFFFHRCFRLPVLRVMENIIKVNVSRVVKYRDLCSFQYLLLTSTCNRVNL